MSVLPKNTTQPPQPVIEPGLFDQESTLTIMHGFPTVTIPLPPGHTPGDLPFFLHLVSCSPPPGTKKEAIPHPKTLKNKLHHFTEKTEIIFITFYKVDVDSYGSYENVSPIVFVSRPHFFGF